MKMAFISRHTPTDRQTELAAEQGYELVHVGDCDAFSVDPSFVHEKGPFEAVAVDHPADLRLAEYFLVGVLRTPYSRSPTS